MRHLLDLVIRGGTVCDGAATDPVLADVAVSDGNIVEVGEVAAGGRVEIDATGMLVTPGFIDIHTHYDGQATWESRMNPSSNHGVTTVVMGNCGVGFAPCRPGDRERLIKLMEGVEDIPGIVMEQGLPWNWETFPQYLDALDARSYDVDIAAQLPHAPLRVYVMRERAVVGEKATADDLRRMTELSREAMKAGALGFATSRSIFHRDSTGAGICTQDAQEEELQAIAEGLRGANAGVIEALMDLDKLESEYAMLKRVVERSGRPLSFTLADVLYAPTAWHRGLELLDQAREEGLPIKAQVIGRPTGLLFGLNLSYNPFSFYPSYQSIAHLPLAERVAELRNPEFRRRLLGEQPGVPTYPGLQMFLRNYEWMFTLGDPPNYEPPLTGSVLARAGREGVTPEDVALDLLLEDDGQAVLMVFVVNYAAGSLDNAYTLIKNDNTLYGLGDGGAHYGLICDASAPTSMLTYWTRDRTRGSKLPLSQVVKGLTSDNAAAMGLKDRGFIAAGYRADINVIDYEKLTLHAPRMRADLPGGGRRLSQAATGYIATMVNGQLTYRDGVHTGALPGRLVRGSRTAPPR